MMVPVQEFKRVQEYYKGQMTENALLNKAGRLAAEEHFILKDKRIPDSMAVKMTKPLSSEQGRLVKRIRTGKTGPLTFRGTEELEGMVDAPVERLLEKKSSRKNPQLPSSFNPDLPVSRSLPNHRRRVLKRRQKVPTTHST